MGSASPVCKHMIFTLGFPGLPVEAEVLFAAPDKEKTFCGPACVWLVHTTSTARLTGSVPWCRMVLLAPVISPCVCVSTQYRVNTFFLLASCTDRSKKLLNLKF